MADEAWYSRFRALVQAGFHDPETLVWKNESANSRRGKLHTDTSTFSAPISEYLRHVKVVGGTENLTWLEAPSEPDTVTPQSIISIRGCPRLALLHTLGSQLQLDPGPLLEHLVLPSTFRSPFLPSSRRNSVSLLMISLGVYQNPQPNTRFEFHQRNMDSDVAKHNASLMEQERDASGAEQCRAVNLHGSRFFSVEQRVTFYPFNLKEHSWSALLLNDAGYRGRSSPWIHSKHTSSPYFYPIGVTGPKSISSPFVAGDFLRAHQVVQQPDPCQSRTKNSAGMTEELQAMALEDPFIVLADLLQTCAQSWALFFGFLREWHRHLEGDEQQKVQILRHDKQVLDRSCEFFSEVVMLLEKWEATSWACCKDTEARGKVIALRKILQDDFTRLLEESKALCELCNDAAAIEMATIGILDSKRGLAQADSIRVLTFLAYLFIPSAFVASVFGMNVLEFTTPNPPLKSFLSVCLPFTAIFGLIPWARELLEGAVWLYNFTRRSVTAATEP